MELFALLLVLAGLWLLLVWAIMAVVRLQAEVQELRTELSRRDSGRSHAADAMAEAPVAEREPEPAVSGQPETASGLSPASFGLERHLTQSWLVWLGGATLALGGAFVVKAAVEEGWFGPAVRMASALVFGAALVCLGERQRRHGMSGYAPASLAAAGVCTLFAEVWAGHVLHGLLPAGVAFPLLAAVAALAVLLAWSPWSAPCGPGPRRCLRCTGDHRRHQPVAMGAACLSDLAHSWRFARAALPSLVVAGMAESRRLCSLAGPRIVFILVATAMFILMPSWAAREDEGAGAHRVVSVAISAFASVMLLLHVLGQPTSVHSLGLLLLCALPLLASQVLDVPSIAVVAPATAPMLALLAWQLDPVALGRDLTGEAHIALRSLRLLPEQATDYVGWASAVAVLYDIAGLALWRGRRPGLTASLAAAVPIITLAILFLRLSDLTPALSWAVLALALSLAELAAAAWSQRRGDGPAVIAAYAVGTLAALALAFTFALGQAWLTVALAAILPALGMVWQWLTVRGLRATALVLAVVVTSRVGLDPEASRLVGEGRRR